MSVRGQSVILLALPILLLSLSLPCTEAATLEGRIQNFESTEPVAFVTVQIEGTGKSTLANADGYYRLLVGPGRQIIKFTHIGYYSQVDTLDLTDSTTVHNVSLRSAVIIVPGDVVYDRQYDPAQLIILEAIRRKKEILERLGSFNYSAYTKTVMRNVSKPDSVTIMMITETQSQSFWERPNKYKEIITARKQSANVNPAENLLSIGEFLNFNRNRIEIGDYQIVSPVAEDALGYYNYYLLDSTYTDQRKIYKLEVEPKNQADALVEGYIFIADSTFDMVDMDIGFNDGVRMPFVKDLRYQQRVANFENKYWMPIELRFSAVVEIDFPGIPDRISGEMAASLYDYSFETLHEKNTFDEFVMEVAASADKFDSTRWIQKQTIPLTREELYGYHRLDSLEKVPEPIGKKLAMVGLGAAALVTFGQPEIFRYNRVEGAFIGAPLAVGLSSGTDLYFKSGYAFKAKLYQYRAGIRQQFGGGWRPAVGVEYGRQVRQIGVVNADECNSTTTALFGQLDPPDYYYSRGTAAWLALSPIRYTRWTFTFQDQSQRSLPQASNFAIFDRDEGFRENPPIEEGDLRSFHGTLEIDSRKLWRNKGRVAKSWASQYTTLQLGIELASPDIANSDFDYKRYFMQFHRRQRTMGLGYTEVDVYAGASTGQLPRQRWFDVTDYSEVLAPEASRFLTVGENFLSGDRALMIYARHDFDNYLFKKSGLPLIKKVPFTLMAYGGVVWTDFERQKTRDFTTNQFEAARPYAEVGFGLGNLTPFLSVFNLAVYLTWQVSDYATNNFTWRIGLKL